MISEMYPIEKTGREKEGLIPDMSVKKQAKFYLILFFIFPVIFLSGCKKTPTTPEVEAFTRPIIWLNSFEMSFSASKTGSAPPPKILKVKNSGQQTLEYTISDDASWLVIQPESGTSTGQIVEHTVTVEKEALSDQTDYSATITVTCPEAYNNPQKVEVSLKLAEKKSPEIQVTPDTLSFASQVGTSYYAAKVIYVKNSGEGTLTYDISDDASWLDVSPEKGTSTGESNTHSVSTNTNDLSEGTYQAVITVTDPDASNSPQKVNVSLKISRTPPPEIQVTPTSLSFSAKEEGSNPPSQNIWVKNSGSQSLNYTISDDADWLNVNPSNGISTGDKNEHTVSVNAGSLSSGTYSAAVTINDSNASNSPQIVNVNLSVTNGQTPEIWVSNTALSFSGTAGGLNPSSQSFQVKNSGAQTLNYILSHDADWLSVDPTNGSSSREENTHQVSVNTQGLGQGTYTGTITVSDANASNSPQNISVTLQLSSASNDNEMQLSLSSSSGGTGALVTVSILVKGNRNEIKCFGLELNFDSNMFQSQELSAGGLTGDWATVDGNEVRAGVIRIGGYTGSGNPVSSGSTGTIALVKLKVTGSNLSDGHQGQICINNYTDDIAGMTPEPCCVSFTYKK
jgi:hypothetical protein